MDVIDVDRAFIKIIDPEEASGTLARAYRRIAGQRGAIAHVHQSQSLNPKAMMAHLDLYMAIMYEDSPLSRKEREIIATVTSFLNECDYCIVHHHEALVANWENAPSPIDLVDGKNLTPKEKIMVKFVRILTLNPGKLNEDEQLSLRENGYSDRAILDICLITGYFNFVNRLVIGTGVQLEDSKARDYNY